MDTLTLEAVVRADRVLQLLDRQRQIGGERGVRRVGGGTAAVNTWNSRRAGVLSWLGWCRERGYEGPMVPAWAKRLAVPDSETPARSKVAVDRLIARREVHLREKALWRMPYETAGRSEEILGVNIEELDLAGRRCLVKAKGARTKARRRGQQLGGNRHTPQPGQDGLLPARGAGRVEPLHEFDDAQDVLPPGGRQRMDGGGFGAEECFQLGIDLVEFMDSGGEISGADLVELLVEMEARIVLKVVALGAEIADRVHSRVVLTCGGTR
ncbi:hypothetical protein [Streptomyces sp. NPDC005969]|uniref:hypothetical protein n=1 Tax=Streptomyces sp. NPDC005969 TaxID=3156722 RepID=UPI0033EA2266